MGINVAAARNFMFANARLLEQLVFMTVFDGADPEPVVGAVAAYRNSDDGFGNGLEPDKRAPGSQPLDVEIAFERLASVGAAADDLVVRACDWLETVSVVSGAVPILLPTVAGYPRAEHWERTHYEPDLNPTAGIAAHVHALRVTHEWAERATDFCFTTLENGLIPDEAHDLLGLTKLVATAPDRQRAQRATDDLRSALNGASYMKWDPTSDTYGITPLEFAPTPTSSARQWFDDDVIESHLDHLIEQQQLDGGWPITWEPPSVATRCEWRAIRTLNALCVLNAYGRLEN